MTIKKNVSTTSGSSRSNYQAFWEGDVLIWHDRRSRAFCCAKAWCGTTANVVLACLRTTKIWSCWRTLRLRRTWTSDGGGKFEKGKPISEHCCCEQNWIRSNKSSWPACRSFYRCRWQNTLSFISILQSSKVVMDKKNKTWTALSSISTRPTTQAHQPLSLTTHAVHWWESTIMCLYLWAWYFHNVYAMLKVIVTTTRKYQGHIDMKASMKGNKNEWALS